MRHSRSPVRKAASARKFRAKLAHTKAPNMAPPPQRGGYRF